MQMILQELTYLLEQSTPSYDNMFAGSNWDAEGSILESIKELRIDAGLKPVKEEDVVRVRNKAARALELGS